MAIFDSKKRNLSALIRRIFQWFAISLPSLAAHLNLSPFAVFPSIHLCLFLHRPHPHKNSPIPLSFNVSTAKTLAPQLAQQSCSLAGAPVSNGTAYRACGFLVRRQRSRSNSDLGWWQANESSGRDILDFFFPFPVSEQSWKQVSTEILIRATVAAACREKMLRHERTASCLVPGRFRGGIAWRHFEFLSSRF